MALQIKASSHDVKYAANQIIKPVIATSILSSFLERGYICRSTMIFHEVGINWYTDTKATNHLKWELDKLTICNKYEGQDQVHVANKKVRILVMSVIL